jgi:Aspartyl protease
VSSRRRVGAAAESVNHGRYPPAAIARCSRVKRALAAAAVLLLAGCGGGSSSAPPTVHGQLLVEIKVIKHGAQVLALVPVTINGKGPYAFALDTGASQSLVDSQVARALRVPATGAKQKIAGVASVSSVKAIRVRDWRVGKVKLPPTTVVEANLPFGNAKGGVQGLLGSDMLSDFDVVTIDYARSRLLLHHRAIKSSG